MKAKYLQIPILFLALTFFTQAAQAQILNKIKNKINEKVNQKIEEKIDKAAQKTIDEADGTSKKSKEEPAAPTKPGDKPADKPANKPTEATTPRSDIDYGTFDFIPGETILFEDEFVNENINEIPSLWLPVNGKLEIVKVDGKNVMGFLDADPSVYPRMKKYNYLPQRFTLEYDFMSKHNAGKSTDQAMGDGNGNGLTDVFFYSDKKDQSTGSFIKDNFIRISTSGEVTFNNYNGQYSKGVKTENKSYVDLNDKWIHVSIAVTETNMKVYINSQRVLNAPVDGKAASIMLRATGSDYEQSFKTFIRNVRIAGGLKDPYKQGTSEIPKLYIARGIKFDFNQSTLKPESMGELKNVVAMLNDHPETKYEIGGHTDSDGDDKYNLNLSQQRADAVKAKLVEMGIAPARLTTKGYGAGKPMADNLSPEGKANNRRVELTLMK